MKLFPYRRGSWPLRIDAEITITEECLLDADTHLLLRLREEEADRIRRELVEVYGRVVK